MPSHLSLDAHSMTTRCLPGGCCKRRTRLQMHDTLSCANEDAATTTPLGMRFTCNARLGGSDDGGGVKPARASSASLKPARRASLCSHPRRTLQASNILRSSEALRVMLYTFQTNRQTAATNQPTDRHALEVEACKNENACMRMTCQKPIRMVTTWQVLSEESIAHEPHVLEGAFAPTAGFDGQSAPLKCACWHHPRCRSTAKSPATPPHWAVPEIVLWNAQ